MFSMSSVYMQTYFYYTIHYSCSEPVSRLAVWREKFGNFELRGFPLPCFRRSVRSAEGFRGLGFR